MSMMWLSLYDEKNQLVARSLPCTFMPRIGTVLETDGKSWEVTSEPTVRFPGGAAVASPNLGDVHVSLRVVARGTAAREA